MTEITQLLDTLQFSEERQEQVQSFFNKSTTANSTDEDVPWFMTALTGGSAWIAAILFMIFLFLPFGDAPFIAGLLPLASAVGINRLLKRTVFWEQLSLALGMAGQIIWAVEIFDNSADSLFWLLPLIGVIIFLAHEGKFHRFFTVGLNLILFEFNLRGSFGLFSGFSSDEGLYQILGTILFLLVASGVCWVWLNSTKFEFMKRDWGLRSLGFGLIASTFFSLIYQRILLENASLQPIYSQVVGLCVLIILAVIVYLIANEHSEHAVIWVAIMLLILAFPTWQTPGLVWAIALLLLSWQRQDSLLFGISILATAGFLSLFYYDLEISLLNKSYVLVSSGLAMLAIRFGWAKLIQSNVEVQA
ncbi:MAG: DUF4401 domain-containing protein [Anaerolineae bacterium]